MKATRICVVTGCQMDGLVSAFKLLFPHFEVEGYYAHTLAGDAQAAICERLLEADHIFALPLEPHFGEATFAFAERLGPRLRFVPIVTFAAFHPDLTYLGRLDHSRVQTPMTDYHSTIAVAAYLEGYDVDRTVRLFNAYTYQALGYFDLVEASSRHLLAEFAAHGLDMSAPLARWLRQPEPFMLSTNHPRIAVLADVAVEAARAAGLVVEPPMHALAAMPDRLAEFIVYPVYKEIAARLGKVGDTRFQLRPDDEPRHIDLATFVARSFASYDQDDVSRWAVSERIGATREILGRLTRQYGLRAA